MCGCFLCVNYVAQRASWWSKFPIAKYDFDQLLWSKKHKGNLQKSLNKEKEWEKFVGKYKNTVYYCTKCSDLTTNSIFACYNPNNDSQKKCYITYLNNIIIIDDVVVV